MGDKAKKHSGLVKNLNLLTEYESLSSNQNALKNLEQFSNTCNKAYKWIKWFLLSEILAGSGLLYTGHRSYNGGKKLYTGLKKRKADKK